MDGSPYRIGEPLRQRLRALPLPRHFFAGLKLADGLAPDNILLFRRSDTRAFRPRGVMDNHHHRFELVLVLERPGPVRIGETAHFLSPGEGALIFPYQFHHYLDVEPGPMEWLFITFELAASGRLDPLRDSPRRFGPAFPSVMMPVIARLLELYPRADAVAEISALVARLLTEMLAAPPLQGGTGDLAATDQTRDLVLEKINDHVRRHLGETMTIASLAEAIGYSEGHVRSVFRNRLGISLGRYIRHSRLSESARRLQEAPPGTSLAQIAQEVGFGSTAGFCHAFRKVYGLTPGRYAQGARRPETLG